MEEPRRQVIAEFIGTNMDVLADKVVAQLLAAGIDAVRLPASGASSEGMAGRVEPIRIAVSSDQADDVGHLLELAEDNTVEPLPQQQEDDGTPGGSWVALSEFSGAQADLLASMAVSHLESQGIDAVRLPAQNPLTILGGIVAEPITILVPPGSARQAEELLRGLEDAEPLEPDQSQR